MPTLHAPCIMLSTSSLVSVCYTRVCCQVLSLAPSLKPKQQLKRQDIWSALTRRPVDCNSGSLLSYDSGFVNSTIYSDQLEAGWGYHPWISGQPKVQASLLDAQGAGINKSTAICATLPPGASLCQTPSLCQLSAQILTNTPDHRC